MAQKNNIRSIRFSDELAELIDRQAGRTFTEKFEGLITRCVWELPQKERQLEEIKKQIDQERQRLYDLQRATAELRRLEQDIKSALLQNRGVAGEGDRRGGGERRIVTQPGAEDHLAARVICVTGDSVTQTGAAGQLDAGRICVTKAAAASQDNVLQGGERRLPPPLFCYGKSIVCVSTRNKT